MPRMSQLFSNSDIADIVANAAITAIDPTLAVHKRGLTSKIGENSWDLKSESRLRRHDLGSVGKSHSVIYDIAGIFLNVTTPIHIFLQPPSPSTCSIDLMARVAALVAATPYQVNRTQPYQVAHLANAPNRTKVH